MKLLCSAPESSCIPRKLRDLLVLPVVVLGMSLVSPGLADAETYETPFGDVTADQQFSVSEPSYRYELSYTDPSGSFAAGGWSEGRPDYGLHSDVRVSVNGVEVGNHQHYGYEGSLIENNFDLGDLRTEQKLGGDGYRGAVFYNGECVYGCPAD